MLGKVRMLTCDEKKEEEVIGVKGWFWLNWTTAFERRNVLENDEKKYVLD